ncbi:MAG: trypsin-like peptidase domain-containing protein [Lachnospiraceae bacterium]|nr:trypsin-like peptidase domain-containing protein [Lachnospiraceae bacterium]
MDERWNGNQEMKGNQGNQEMNGLPMNHETNGNQMNQEMNSIQSMMGNQGYENVSDMQQGDSKKNRGERRRQEKLQRKALKKERKEKRRNSFFAKAGRMAAYGLLFGGAFGLAFQGINLGKNYLLTGSFYFNEESSSEKANQEIQEVTLLTTKETDSSVAAVVNNVMPSIVSVTSTFEEVGYDFFFNQYSKESTGYGSGIIIGKSDDTLLVVTNYHVVEGAKEVAVGFIDSEYVTATVKGYDSDADLAVLSISLEDMEESTIGSIKVAVLGDSELLLVGEQAIAIGNAMGYGQSVTVGYVSALNREVQLTDKTMTLLQTDAAINPGNSGGALLNSKGEVIGINTVKYSDTSVEGMGYAIPISTATPIINDLMNQEVIEEKDKAFLGVGGDTVTEEYNERFGMPIGAYVSKVSDNSPAERAGINAGDIITQIGEYEIESWEDLQNAIEQYKGGESTVIVLQRSNSRGQYKEKEIEVTFGYRSENQ